MIGKLDPEENVMEDNLFQSSQFTEQSLIQAYTELGWDMRNDDIHVEIGGTQVSGIEQPEGYNKKWSSQKGDRKYNKDAFIVIKNRSLNLTVSSVPNTELKPHHIKVAEQEIAIQQDEKAIAAALKKSDDASGYDTYSK